MRKLPLAARLVGYRLAHAAGGRGRPRQLPINLTVSVTYACPSRCATCDIWRKQVEDLSVEEYARLFPTLQKVPVWVTLSGGDQFVRADFDEVVRLVCTLIDPRIVNIPMNGVITERIFTALPKIAHHTAGRELVLNLSVDEIGEAHDDIRGAPRNFEKLRLVADLVHDLKKTYPHIVFGVHTVISKLNVHRIADIEREARAIFRPDSYIAEVAERRVELGTMHKDITPDPAELRRAVEHLCASIRAHRSTAGLGQSPVARLVESLRLEYYELAVRVLEEKRQVIDCYAGWASGQIAPDGHVWGCCVRAESLGNVRDHGYDFRTVWDGAEADAFRESVRAHACACPLANASYTNLLLDVPSIARVSAHMAGVR